MSTEKSILTATEFYETRIAPLNVDKKFQVPAWAISFAEKYAEYLAIKFHLLNLKIEIARMENDSNKLLSNMYEKMGNQEEYIKKEE